MTGISDAGRSALERAITKARRTLEDDLAGIAEGRFGIHRRGEIEDEASLRLSSSELLDRREVLAVVRHLRNEGESAQGAVDRVIREACFTHLNRLVAIRIAEAIGLLMPSLVDGKASRGFREVLEVAPLLASDQYGGYWSYLRLCADELAADAPVLFDPRNPLLALAPSPPALDELVSLLGDSTLKDAWLASDTLGWAYQFFNTSDERRQMREAGAPRSSRELAVRNQFFTPRYVVDFLVQNSLGRRLLEADHQSGLIADLPLLIDPPREAGPALALDELLVLDPACGSGHFLLGAYDLLEKAWERAGVPPQESASRILPCLHGIDIDSRCAQVASAAVLMRARRACPSGDLPRPGVVTARSLPRDEDAWRRVLDELPPERQRLLVALRSALQQAPLLGSLLKVGERLTSEIQQAVPEAVPNQLWYQADALGRAEAEVLAVLQRIADQAASTPEERLLAAESGDAIRFVEAMRRRYDVVLMNPPFGEPVTETKPYLKATYPWLPPGANLEAAFVGRGLELVRDGGYVGAITSRSGMFLTTFKAWRQQILLGNDLVVLADLGIGVMAAALVEAAAYVVKRAEPAGRRTVFARMVRETDRESRLTDLVRAANDGLESSDIFRVPVHDLRAIPGAPVAYWLTPSIRGLFAGPRLEQVDGIARIGTSTGDDYRFVRLYWEVDPARIAKNREETSQSRRWVPFAKGGEYSPFWADIHLVVDWENDGTRIRSYSGSRAQNIQYFFRPGITWPLRTGSGFGPRVLPAGCAFGHKGPAIFPQEDLRFLLGWLTSRPARAALDAMVAAANEMSSGTASKSYEVGLIQNLPAIGPRTEQFAKQKIAIATEELIGLRAQLDEIDETSRRFVRPALAEGCDSLADRAESALSRHEDATLTALGLTLDIESELVRALHLDDDDLRYLDDNVGPHPLNYAVRSLSRSEIEAAYAGNLSDAIRAAVADQGGSKVVTQKNYFFDRRLEVASHILKASPSSITDARREFHLTPHDDSAQFSKDLISYMVGVAFGRWDARIGRDRSLAPVTPGFFDPVPTAAPGMLIRTGGLQSRETPEGYPLELPPDGLLLDEPGHQWDLEGTVRRVAEALLDDGEAIVEQLETILGRPLREHLQRKFFKDHLSQYSKSRRQAPIYWQLSVPSLSWSIWVYAPTLSRETLFAIARQAGRRQATGRDTLAALKRDLEAGGRGRSQRELSDRIAEEEDLALELEAFRLEAERVAGLGWEPDLDDGLVLCAAPLTRLLLGWPAAADEWKNLKGGQYPWTTVSRWSPAL